MDTAVTILDRGRGRALEVVVVPRVLRVLHVDGRLPALRQLGLGRRAASPLGANFGLGHGHVDFAGSSVVHMVGGVAALAGAIVLGPRLGKFDKDGKPIAIPGHHIPMATLGTLILGFGWFGFNPGSHPGRRPTCASRVVAHEHDAGRAPAAPHRHARHDVEVLGKPDPQHDAERHAGRARGRSPPPAPSSPRRSLGADRRDRGRAGRLRRSSSSSDAEGRRPGRRDLASTASTAPGASSRWASSPTDVRRRLERRRRAR